MSKPMERKSAKRPAADAAPGAPGAPGGKKHAGAKKQRKDGKEKKTEEKPELKSGKELKQARKLHKPHGEMVEAAKKLWGEIRVHDQQPAKRAKLVAQLFELISGQMHDVIFRHDAARVVQCCIQFGTPEQRNAIFEELKGHWVEIMKSTYGKFVVTKMLDYGTKEQKAQIISSMYGQVRKLMRHQEAANIVDAAFTDHTNSAQRSALVQEFYSPEFAVFKGSNVKTLAELLQEKPDSRDSILKFVHETLTATISKGTISYSLVHRIIREFFECANDAMKQELAGQLAEHIVGILHTRDGSLAAMHVLWNTPAKERKAIIKTFKTHVAKIAKEEYGHHVLLSLFDQIDDTVLVKKSIVNELIADLEELCTDKFARLVLLYMLTPRNTRYVHPAHIKTLTEGDSNPFSKKDREVRAREVRESISAPLLDVVSNKASEWVGEGKPAQVVEESILHAEGAEKEREKALRAVLALVDSEEGILEHPVGGLVVKRLILSPLTIDGGRIGEAVWKLAQGRVGEIVKSKQGCYTLAALLAEDQPQSLRESVAAALANVDLPAETATGENGKPLPGAVLAKAAHAVLPAAAGKKKAGAKAESTPAAKKKRTK